MFNIGDVVKLKSGGPAMTIITRFMEDGDFKYGTAWFGENGDMGLAIGCSISEFSEVCLALKGSADYNKLA